ncbi:hypothetical protein E1B28_003253 [Marasmius oreades]|uniref:Uncharacterized protein n=1 Tax=Marasmius oreades TaxID=181124 RepID=A0A9P7RL70_9AGAR|nr:uncharacterized protein E1B28_003253 [Marasmius oreades]KAG7085709.1 hypothetical protein E1B28_003253 [Marasmius oreades]
MGNFTSAEPSQAFASVTPWEAPGAFVSIGNVNDRRLSASQRNLPVRTFGSILTHVPGNAVAQRGRRRYAALRPSDSIISRTSATIREVQIAIFIQPQYVNKPSLNILNVGLPPYLDLLAQGPLANEVYQ